MLTIKWNDFTYRPLATQEESIFDPKMEGGNPGRHWLHAVLAKNIAIISMPATTLQCFGATSDQTAVSSPVNTGLEANYASDGRGGEHGPVDP